MKISSYTICLIVVLSFMTGMLKESIGEVSKSSKFTLGEFIIGWGIFLCLFALAYIAGRMDEKNKKNTF